MNTIIETPTLIYEFKHSLKLYIYSDWEVFWFAAKSLEDAKKYYDDVVWFETDVNDWREWDTKDYYTQIEHEEDPRAGEMLCRHYSQRMVYELWSTVW